MNFVLNSKSETIPERYRDDRLLWLLRDHFGLRGPKLGCGIGVCGACAVHVDGAAGRACVLRASDIAGRQVTTLEGLGAKHTDGLHPVQRAWIEASVPQCGYCQNGQIMTAAGLLSVDANASVSEIERTMNTVLCRCGTHARIRTAIGKAKVALGGRK